jgi:hypothetical protein
MSCVLRAHGLTFDVDAFLKESSLTPLTVFHQGEPRAPGSNPGGRLIQHSGMNVAVSTGEFSELRRQIEDAILFLETHREEMRRLREFPGGPEVELDFPIEERDVAVQLTCPPSLVQG